MMRRVRLNMYRAEDEMFIIRKRQVGGGSQSDFFVLVA